MFMNPQVDLYLENGCGRCALFKTPECKVHRWEKELEQLRHIVLECGLTEALKWSVPCYTFNGSNILILAAFKDYCSLSFFKGTLLQDARGWLDAPGENSQAVRQLRFTSPQMVADRESIVREYIYEAIEVENAGLKVDFKEKKALAFPEELLNKFEEMPALRAAFEALTPGRQRGYNLYFSAPKQSKTRTARVEKYIPHILNGKGWNEE